MACSCTAKVGSYWLFCPAMNNIVAMAIQADMEGVLCLSHILFMAFLTLNQVDHILGLTSGHSSYMEGLSSNDTPYGGACFNVVAGEAAFIVTGTTSSGLLKKSWLELCTDQKVTKYHVIPHSTMQYHAIPHSTMQYHTLQCNTTQYHVIPYSTVEYHVTRP